VCVCFFFKLCVLIPCIYFNFILISIIFFLFVCACVCFQFPLFPLPMVFFFSVLHFKKKNLCVLFAFFFMTTSYCCFCDCCASLTTQHFGYKKLHYDLNSHCSFVFNRLFLFVDVCITFF